MIRQSGDTDEGRDSAGLIRVEANEGGLSAKEMAKRTAPHFGDERLPQRFWDKCIPVPLAGCWLWTGCTSSCGSRGGYGQIRINWRLYSAHVLAYRTLVGEYPSKLDLDHLCRVRSCCNPLHLEPVTRSVNLLRGDGFHRHKTHCPAGHAYDAANTYVYRGRRNCRACHREVTRQTPPASRRTPA